MVPEIPGGYLAKFILSSSPVGKLLRVAVVAVDPGREMHAAAVPDRVDEAQDPLSLALILLIFSRPRARSLPLSPASSTEP